MDVAFAQTLRLKDGKPHNEDLWQYADAARRVAEEELSIYFRCSTLY